MQNRIGMIALACALSAIVSLAARAQTVADTSHQAADSATVQPKKGGMFSKMKGLAHNKTVQNIAKAAVCTAVPGGSLVVGAIDAKQNKSAGSLVGGAAAAAAGAGAGCMPGMGSLAGMGGLGGVGGASGMMGAALGGGVPKPGLAGAALSGVATAGRMAAMQKAMGAAGGAAPGSAQLAASGGNVQTMTAQMHAMAAQRQMANGGAALQTDAPGQQLQVPGDLKGDLAKGKLVIKKVDWVQHGNLPSASSQQTLTDVMTSIGAAIKQSGAKYRVDVYVGKDYQDTEAKPLAASRITTVIGLMNDGAQVGDAVQPGKAERDKEPRIEIVKVK